MDKNMKGHVDPKPEHGKDVNAHDGQRGKGGNGKHKGWEKKQTTAHGITCIIK